MPELPEVETVVRGLSAVLPDRTILHVALNRPDLRFPFPDRFAGRLIGQRITRVTRCAKYIVVALDGGDDLIIHLGMTGRISLTSSAQSSPRVLGDYTYPTDGDTRHDHVILHLNAGLTVTYNDPRRFGYMLLIPAAQRAQHPLFKSLGAEPLEDGFNAAYLALRAQGTTVPLKTFLMDQRVIAGLGNIYVSEALFRAGLSPNRAAASLSRADGGPTVRTERLAGAIKAVLAAAIEAGGSTLRDYRAADGARGSFQKTFLVYGRAGEPCRRDGCHGTIKRTVHAGRSTFACGSCQR